MQQPEKFISIEYPQIDFLIPTEYILSTVGVKDLEMSLLHNQDSGVFDFNEIASEFGQSPRESEIKTMIVLKVEDKPHLSIVTTQECRVCTIKLSDFGLFSDYYTNLLEKFGILACCFSEQKLRLLINAEDLISYMNNCMLEEL